jgi:hypothetical protein
MKAENLERPSKGIGVIDCTSVMSLTNSREIIHAKSLKNKSITRVFPRLG